MADSSTFVADLYDAVLGGTGVNAVPGGTYVTLEWPGLPIDPQQYGNIWASDHQTGSPEALEWFSSLADDDTPALAPLYQPGGVSLAQVYALVLAATVPPGPVANSFAAAQAVFANTIRSSLQNPGASFHPTWPAPRAWCDGGNEALWTSVTLQPGATTAAVHTLSPALRAALAPKDLLSWRVGAPVAAHSVGKAAVAPINLRANMLALRPAALEAKPMMRPSPAALFNAPGRLAAATKGALRMPTFPPTPIHVDPFPPLGPVTGRPVTTPHIGASFKFIRVGLQRGWLDTTLLHLPGWTIDGLTAGAISNGRSDTNPGMLPLLPTGFIAIKDLTISGAWSAADQQATQAALSSSSTASFGPITLAAGGASLGAFNGATLSVPGIQIIAWTCATVPLAPH